MRTYLRVADGATRMVEVKRERAVSIVPDGIGASAAGWKQWSEDNMEEKEARPKDGGVLKAALI